MAVILLYEAREDFKDRLLKVLAERQNFIIKTQYGREDTLPAVLLDLLYRKLPAPTIEDYDLRSWADGGGKMSIRGTFEGKKAKGSKFP